MGLCSPHHYRLKCGSIHCNVTVTTTITERKETATHRYAGNNAVILLLGAASGQEWESGTKAEDGQLWVNHRAPAFLNKETKRLRLRALVHLIGVRAQFRPSGTLITWTCWVGQGCHTANMDSTENPELITNLKQTW